MNDPSMTILSEIARRCGSVAISEHIAGSRKDGIFSARMREDER